MPILSLGSIILSFVCVCGHGHTNSHMSSERRRAPADYDPVLERSLLYGHEGGGSIMCIISPRISKNVEGDRH